MNRQLNESGVVRVKRGRKKEKAKEGRKYRDVLDAPEVMIHKHISHWNFVDQNINHGGQKSIATELEWLHPIVYSCHSLQSQSTIYNRLINFLLSISLDTTIKNVAADPTPAA